MRRMSTLLLAAVTVALVASCSGTSQNTDPYDLARKAMDADWARVQVEVGLSATSGSDTFTIEKSAIRLVVDSTAGKGSFHLALPAEQLGMDALTRAQLGITGDTIDVDILYDGAALYAKSSMLGFILTLLYAQAGGPPAGDLTGWLRLGTADDFETLFQDTAGSAVPSLEPVASIDAKTLKEDLEANGIVLTFAASEQKNGVDANHLTATIDLEKLVQNDAFDSLDRTQLDQISALAKEMTLTGDLWIDKASNRIVELDVHAVATGQDAGTIDVTVTLSEPAAGTSFDAPASYVDIPVEELFTLLMGLMGQGIFGS
jgi:hypothetical protein